MKTKKKKSIKRKGKKDWSRALKAIQELQQRKTGGMMGMMGGMMGGMPNMGKIAGGPGTHAPVKASGKSVGMMADGSMIHLTGPKKGQMV